MEAVSVGRFVVEVLDAHGRVQFRSHFRLEGDRLRVTLGRGAGADVIVDDPHVAGLHAAIEVSADGRIHVTDLGSRNGIVVDGRRMHAALAHPLAGGEFEIGRSAVRVRTDREVLAPERHDRDIDLGRTLPWIAGMGALVWLGWIVYSVWLEAPRDAPTQIASSVALAGAGAAVWVAAWSLLSRMLQGRWRWTTHAAIFFGVSAAAYGLDLLVDVGWFSLGLPQLDLGDALLLVLATACVLYLHLTNASALRLRTAMLFAGIVPLLVVATATWVQARNHARDVNHIGVRERVYPPALRLRNGISVDEYFADVARLKAEADRKRKAMPASDAEVADDLAE